MPSGILFFNESTKVLPCQLLYSSFAC